jgi:hypothetical protein
MNATQDRVTQLLEKFQEVYNLVTDLQEELNQSKSETLLEYDQLQEIVEAVLDNIQGERVQLDDYSLDLNGREVEVYDAYIDATDSFCSRDIIRGGLEHFIKKKEYCVGYTTETKGEDTSKTNSEFVRVEAISSREAINQVQNKLQNEIWRFNEASDEKRFDYSIKYDYLDRGKFPDTHTRAGIVKVDILEDVIDPVDTEIAIDAVSVE